MSRRFPALTYTDTVRAEQVLAGTSGQAARMAAANTAEDRLSPREAEFIAGRDCFYLATVNEHGWPYVQFRGGPTGFLKVLDDRTLAFADFRGNMQMLSTGNIRHDDRVCLFLMDYARRRRLKILARAEVVHGDEDPALIGELADPAYAAVPERAMILRVEAFDWNCPQHITPRFTAAEIDGRERALRERIAELEARLAERTD